MSATTKIQWTDIHVAMCAALTLTIYFLEPTQITLTTVMQKGERLKTIAMDFNVTDRTISKIALGHRWVSPGQ